MTLNALAARAHDTAKRKGWYDQTRTIPELLMLVVSELSEALEEARKPDARWGEVYYGDNDKPEGLPIELADAIVRIVDMAAHLGIDLDEAVRLKMAYNERREVRHGGKRF